MSQWDEQTKVVYAQAAFIENPISQSIGQGKTSLRTIIEEVLTAE